MVPKISRVAVLANPANPGNAAQLRQAEVVARALGMRLQPLEANSPSEIDRAFAAMTRERADALLVLLAQYSPGPACENKSQTSRQGAICRQCTR